MEVLWACVCVCVCVCVSSNSRMQPLSSQVHRRPNGLIS